MFNPGALVGLYFALNRKPGQQDPVLWAYVPQDERPVASFVVAVCVLAISAGASPIWTLAALPVVLPLFFPWACTRYVFIPLGLAGPARFFTLWAGVAWLSDRFGGSVAAGMWAMLRRRTHDEAWFARQQAQLGLSSLRPGGLLAYGLAAASRGDLRSARLFLESVDDVHSLYTPSLACRLAREWLMLEALERGDWAAIHEHGARSGPRTFVSRFLHGVAAVRLERPYRLAAFRIRLWWLLSGRWVSLWPLLKLALPAAVRVSATDEKKDEAPGQLPAVLARHARLLATPPAAVTVEDLTRVTRGWDAVFAGAGWNADFAGRLRATAVDDLVHALQDAPLAIGELTDAGGTLALVAARVRKLRLAELDETATRLHQRVRAKTQLSPADEWREFLELRAVHRKTAALGGSDVRRLAFSAVYSAVWAHSVWLYNERGEQPLAHAMFVWMLAQATAAGDQTAIQSQTKNAALLPKKAARPPAGWR